MLPAFLAHLFPGGLPPTPEDTAQTSLYPHLHLLSEMSPEAGQRRPPRPPPAAAAVAHSGPSPGAEPPGIPGRRGARRGPPPRRGGGGAAPSAPGARAAFACLLAARLASAFLNIVHDCDETYNYLEPLHFLTWEYSSAFALRPYIYILLHAAVAWPAVLLFGGGRGKVAAFYLIKAALGAASAATEALLYRQGRFSLSLFRAILFDGLFLRILFCTSGELGSAGLQGRGGLVAEGGIVWGWAVAAVAFLPYALWVLASAPLGRAFAVAFGSLAATAAPLLAADRWFYGRWALLLPLALAAPPLLLAAGARAAAPDPGAPGGAGGGAASLLAALSPLYLWLAAVSALPHKEERFLYVVYPLACLAAAASVGVLHSLARSALSRLAGPRAGRAAAAAAAAALVGVSALLGASRVAALVGGYGAPMRIYRHLPEARISIVCL
eukprot:scaffold11.g4057.t1